MTLLQPFHTLNPVQRRTFAACFLGWTLDAFDFFLLTFCLDAIAATFHLSLESAARAIFWTLLMRPIGALAFGLLGVFLGPVLLGVGFTLVKEFADQHDPTLPGAADEV